MVKGQIKIWLILPKIRPYSGGGGLTELPLRPRITTWRRLTMSRGSRQRAPSTTGTARLLERRQGRKYKLKASHRLHR